VISLEINRNCDKRNGKYQAVLAQRKCEKRHGEKLKKIKLTAFLKEYIDKILVKNSALSKYPGQPKGNRSHTYPQSGSISISGRIKNRRVCPESPYTGQEVQEKGLRKG
jgi:IS30 family transposase